MNDQPKSRLINTIPSPHMQEHISTLNFAAKVCTQNYLVNVESDRSRMASIFSLRLFQIPTGGYCRTLLPARLSVNVLILDTHYCCLPSRRVSPSNVIHYPTGWDYLCQHPINRLCGAQTTQTYKDQSSSLLITMNRLGPIQKSTPCSLVETGSDPRA